MNGEGLDQRLAGLSEVLAPLLSVEAGNVVAWVDRDSVLGVAEELLRIGFERLDMVTAVDRGEHFIVVYRVESQSLSAALFTKVMIAREDARVASVCGVWPAANWQEREVYDLFGIVFEGHPDLRRMFLPDEFVGHPLRRDYDDPRMIRRPDYI